jgi:hypothetical protein
MGTIVDDEKEPLHNMAQMLTGIPRLELEAVFG